MSRFLLFAFVSVVLFALSAYAVVTYASLLRKILALNVMGSAVFLMLAAIAAGDRQGSPDPVPHAMVLTGIVVAVSVTAFALALVRRLHAETGSACLPEADEQ